jgi:signal transduction histidine kinase
MGQLAAGLAHEIRNPLTAMKMLIQATRHGDATLEPQDLAILDEEIRRLEALMEEFLDFARPRPLKKTVIDVRVAVEGAVAAVQRLADARNVQIECRLPTEPALVPLDSGRMRQVLLNLLMNGIEETPHGKTVKVAVLADASGASMQILIEDEGPGIDEIAEPRLFEPFFSTKETGLGLGLPMSRRIVESHGGTLTATSSHGGSQFLVTLPTSDV